MTFGALDGLDAVRDVLQFLLARRIVHALIAERAASARAPSNSSVADRNTAAAASCRSFN